MSKKIKKIRSMGKKENSEGTAEKSKCFCIVFF